MNQSLIVIQTRIAMLHYYPANKTEDLVQVLAQILRQSPLSDPFAPEWVLTQSHGMGVWLQQQLSSELGVAAHIQCPMPGQFVWKLAQWLMPELSTQACFDKSSLRWHLFECLPALLDQPEFLPLQQYLAQRGSDAMEQNALARFELCSALADVFDAYQNYRPDWLATLEQGASLQALPEEWRQPGLASISQWQALLWRALYPDQPLSQRAHRGQVLQQLLATLQKMDTKSAVAHVLPERIFVFGLSALPPQMLDVFARLSRHCTVHFLVQNPCRHYWGDVLTERQQLRMQQSLLARKVSPDIAAAAVPESNPLLASWGVMAREHLTLLTQLDTLQEFPEELFSDNADARQCALQRIQDDILNLQTGPHVVSKDDMSLRFADCHSALREVEALHDYLLHLLDTNPSLTPRDIIVMMPDVERFAPLIDAVFSRTVSSAAGLEQRLSFAISDQSVRIDHPQLEAVLSWLKLPSLRLTVAEMMDWLELEAVRSRFGIDVAQLAVIEQWIEQLNIRWGLDEAHRDQQLDMQGSGLNNTWLAGFRRLLAGYLFADGSIVQDGLGPVLARHPGSSELAVLAANLLHFLDVIAQTLSVFAQQLTPQDWCQQLSRYWLRWFDTEVLDAVLVQRMDAALETLVSDVQAAGFHTAVPFSVMAAVLSDSLQSERVSQRFLSGRINFCTLMPMRSIPFKVVCLIGMNETDYPRKEPVQSFDLLQRTRRRLGDRSRRDDDRYLFLEALCSAREHLYISFCGRDVRDNSPREPSVLVSELRDYCERFLQIDLKCWTWTHRLQPFHPDYYRASNPDLLQSFNHDWLDTTSAVSVERASVRSDEPVSACLWELDDLAAIANHPLKQYYQQTLQLNYDAMQEQPEAHEPFALDGLDRYQITESLLRAWQEPDVADQVRQQWVLQGRLPRPPLEQLAWQSAQDTLASMSSQLALFHEARSRFMQVQTPHGQTVRGQVVVAAHGRVELFASNNLGKNFFGAWVRHVAWNLYVHEHAATSQAHSHLLCPEKRLILPPLSLNDAHCFMQQIVDFSAEALRTPQPFLAQTAYARLFETESKAQQAFRGSERYAGESADAYWQRACLAGGLSQHQRADLLPDLTGSLWFKQVLDYLDGIVSQTLNVS